jgi:hypothetical protein
LPLAEEKNQRKMSLALIGIIFYFIFCLLSAAMGIFLLRYPKSAIELQKKFYACINWRIEPINLEKEIRNTRLMGGILLVVFLSALAVLFRPN